MSYSKHTENEKNHIFILGENALKINNTTIHPEAKLKTNCYRETLVQIQTTSI